MKRCIFLICLLLPVASFALSQQIQEVTAEGVGGSEREAVEDAFRNAIENSIGLYVDSETKLQNDKLISDSILTGSKGYIDKYRLLSVINEGGLTKVEIKALVKIQDVKSKLSGLNISTISTDNSADIHARLSSKLTRSQDAEKIFKKELDDFFQKKNLLDLLEIKLTGYKIDESELAQDNTVPYEVSFKIFINLDNYNKRINELAQVFKGLGGTLNRTLHVTTKKKPRYSTHARIDQKEFQEYSKELYEDRGDKIKHVCFGLVYSEDPDSNNKYRLDHYCFPTEWKTIYPWNQDTSKECNSCGRYFIFDDLEITLQFTNNDTVVVYEKKPAFKRYYELNQDPLRIYKATWPNVAGQNPLRGGWGSVYQWHNFGSGFNIVPFIEDGTVLVSTISMTFKDRIDVDLLYDISKVELKLGIKEQ